MLCVLVQEEAKAQRAQRLANMDPSLALLDHEDGVSDFSDIDGKGIADQAAAGYASDMDQEEAALTGLSAHALALQPSAADDPYNTDSDGSVQYVYDLAQRGSGIGSGISDEYDEQDEHEDDREEVIVSCLHSHYTCMLHVDFFLLHLKTYSFT